jgi:hypothetical protein
LYACNTPDCRGCDEQEGCWRPPPPALPPQPPTLPPPPARPPRPPDVSPAAPPAHPPLSNPPQPPWPRPSLSSIPVPPSLPPRKLVAAATRGQSWLTSVLGATIGVAVVMLMMMAAALRLRSWSYSGQRRAPGACPLPADDAMTEAHEHEISMHRALRDECAARWATVEAKVASLEAELHGTNATVVELREQLHEQATALAMLPQSSENAFDSEQQAAV